MSVKQHVGVRDVCVPVCIHSYHVCVSRNLLKHTSSHTPSHFHTIKNTFPHTLTHTLTHNHTCSHTYTYTFTLTHKLSDTHTDAQCCLLRKTREAEQSWGQVFGSPHDLGCWHSGSAVPPIEPALPCLLSQEGQ